VLIRDGLGLPAADVLDQVPAAVIAVDLDSLVTYWGPGAERLYGWTAQEAVGRLVRELILQGQPMPDEVLARTRAGEVWEGEVLVRHRDGSDLLVFVRNAPLLGPDGTLVGVLGASLDATELRRLEAERASHVSTLGSLADRAAERIGRLQRLTAALVPARTAEEVVAVVVDIGIEAVGAAAGGVSLLEEDRQHVVVVGQRGYDTELVSTYARLPLSMSMPVTDAIRTSVPLLFRDADDWARAYPQLPAVARFRARGAVPITAGGAAIGALSVSFADSHDFADDEIELLLTIARQCGQALERIRLLGVEQRASQVNAFLAEASGLLSRSLSVDRTLSALTSLLVPRLADWVVVHLQEDDRAVARAVAHRDPDAEEALRSLALGHPVDTSGRGGAAEALRTGRSVLHSTVPEAVRARMTLPEPYADLADRLTANSGLAAPLVVGAQVLGALSLARIDRPAYSEADVALVEELASRAAVALSNARAYQFERESALALQQSLLPQVLPDLPGLSFDWRYLPGAEGALVGGDWYDVFALDHGRVGLVIGDVMGRGVAAAAVMGQLRAMARAYAEARLRPAEVLGRLDAALSRLEQGAITTLLYLEVDPATATVIAASAGHLPPLVSVPGHGPTFLEIDPGPPLGAGPGTYPETRQVLSRDATLLLFTDGLVEDREQSVEQGLLQLAAAVAGSPDGNPGELCDRALAGMGRNRAYDDDTALLAVALTGGRGGLEPFTSMVVHREDEIAEVRAELRRHALLWHLPDEVTDDLVLVATELTSNAVLHVGGAVTVTARLEPSRVRLEVHDHAPSALPLPSLSTLTESAGRLDDAALDEVIAALTASVATGRGMGLVDRLARDWGVITDRDGKIVWVELGREDGPAREPDSGHSTSSAVWLRGVPVRLVLASAANLDEMMRELVVAPTAGALPEVGTPARELLMRSARTRDPFRLAAREALARGQRTVDVQAPADERTPELLATFQEMLDALWELGQEGKVLAIAPDPEIVAFRSWWREEIAAQLAGRPPVECPFPPLPAAAS
jgi:PAS domain S-box-containing protein